MNALVIINPYAGKGRGKNYLFPITDALSKAGCRTTVHITQAPEEATKIVKQIGTEFDYIICCGGDGTFQETIGGIITLSHKPIVGYIPCGTTNDLAKSLNIPADPESNIANILSGNYRYLDIGSFKDKYFSYIASFGMLSSVSYDTPQTAKNLLGHTAYVLNGISHVFKTKPTHLCWQCDDLKGESDYLFGCISNTLSIGGIYKLPPAAVSLDDGMLELILIQNCNSNIEILPNLITKRFNEESENRILILKGKRFVFDFDEPIPFTLDGEYGGTHSHIEINCLENAIRFASATISSLDGTTDGIYNGN